MQAGQTIKLFGKSFGKPLGGNGILLLIDLQERLAPAVPRAVEVLPLAAQLIEECRKIDLPILATEQYSRGLGPTVAELRARLASQEMIEKIHFAASREPDFMAALGALGRRRCLVAGMEAHVCVQQTVLGLLQAGYEVTLLEDAVASRADLNRRVALARMAAAGAAVTPAASIFTALPLSSAARARTMGPSA